MRARLPSRQPFPRILTGGACLENSESNPITEKRACNCLDECSHRICCFQLWLAEPWPCDTDTAVHGLLQIPVLLAPKVIILLHDHAFTSKYSIGFLQSSKNLSLTSRAVQSSTTSAPQLQTFFPLRLENPAFRYVLHASSVIVHICRHVDIVCSCSRKNCWISWMLTYRALLVCRQMPERPL